MNKFGLGVMQNPNDAKVVANSIIMNMYQKEQFNKKYANEFLDSIMTTMTSEQNSPEAKTNILHVLKEFTYQGETKFFSVLANHKILEFLTNQAKTIDPKKPYRQKGLRKFPNNPEKGQQYTRLLLELINFWGQKFAKGRNAEQTKYKKNLTQLKNLEIQLPTKYQIIDVAEFRPRNRASKTDNMTSSGQKQSSYKLGSVGPEASQTPKPPSGKLAAQVGFIKDKVEIFLEKLQQQHVPDKILEIINSNHSFFDKQWPKYQKRGAQVEKDEQVQPVYFALDHFIGEQKVYYQQYIHYSNDLSSYITKLKILYQKVFDKKQSPVARFPNARPQQVSPLFGNPNQPRPNQKPAGLNQGLNMISTLYKKLQDRSKSPGFKGMQVQLQKEKQSIRKSPMRNTTRSPRNLNRSQQGGLNRSNASNLRESKVQVHPIFTSPPNPRISNKNYEGQTIFESKQLSRALYNLKKQQGSRRFKTSNFRQKNPLFENDHIQVGYKSQAIYETINQFNHFIMLNIYIGNKTEEGIKQFQVEYKGDSNQLLYANPKSVDLIIPPGYQNKHDLMITPLSVPYSLMTMHISYRFRDSECMTSILLPNSVLKFASYMKTNRSQFDSNWRSARKFKTNPFKLCKFIAPDSFGKWIPVLYNLTQYSEFSREGSETDLELICTVVMLRKYQAVLKINVRPNLHVVLQLGVMDNNQEGLQYFKFYLQSLELILKEIDI